MKVFVFSRRFLIPFILALIGYAGYFAWEMWQLYKIDFNGKGISSSVKYEWLWTIISGGTILSAVLLALFTGIIFYSHYRIRREERWALFYSSGNIAAILIIAIAGFVYTSFYEPRSYKRSMDLLSSIVYARTAEEFNSEINRKDDGLRNERMLTLPELCNAKDSLSAGSKTTGKYNFFDTPESMLKKIKFQIAKKAGYPFLLLIFYTIGVLLAVSLRKIHVVFPLLIGFFILFWGFLYGQRIFEYWYKTGKVGVFAGANAMTLILAVISLIWFFSFEKKNDQICKHRV